MTLTFLEVEAEKLDREARTFEVRHDTLPATIKSREGVTGPPSQPNYTFVAYFNQPEGLESVFNNKVLAKEGLAVWVGPQIQPPFQMEIKGTYDGSLEPFESESPSNYSSGPHGQTHQTADESDPGDDEVKVFTPMLQPLKVTGNGTTLTVTIQTLNYTYGNDSFFYGGQTIDLTSSVPSVASTKRYTLVYLNKLLNICDVIDGDTVPDLSAFIPPLPSKPDFSVISGYVLLANGQANVTTATHILDRRGWLDNNDGALVPLPISPGQILIVNDASNVQWFTPITSGSGWLSSQEGELLTVE